MKDDLQVPEFGRTLIGFIRTRPWICLLLGVLIVAGMGSGLGKIEADFTYRGFFWSDDPLVVAFDAFERKFGNDDAVVVAVHSPSGIFDEDSANLIVELSERMWQVPEVLRVDSLSTFNWVHAEGDELIVEPFLPDQEPISQDLLDQRRPIALAHEVLPSYLISTDATTAMIFAVVKPAFDGAPNAPAIIGAVRELQKEFERGDHVIHISGGPAVSLGFAEASQTDFAYLVPLVLILTTILLGILLRSLVGIFLALTVVFFSIAATMAFGGHVGIQISNVTAVMPQILIAIGVADAVHIWVTYRVAGEKGLKAKDAVEYSLLKNFLPTLLTSVTTAVGFYSFITADLKPISGLGTLAGTGALFAWLFTYLVMGSLMFILPLRSKKATPSLVEHSRERASAIVDGLVRYRTAIIAVFVVATVAGGAFALQNEVNSDPFKYFRVGFPLRVANEFIEENVGGARGVELVVEAGTEEGVKDPTFLRKVEAYQAWVDQQPGVTRSLSIIDILKQTHRSLHADDPEMYLLAGARETLAQELFLYQMSLPQGMSLNDRVTVKNDAMRITVLWTLKTSQEAVAAIDTMEAKGKEMGLEVWATGKNRLWQSMNGYVVNSFIVSLSAALLLISLILILFFRSIPLGLLAMIPNGVPLVIGAGILWLIGQPLDVGTVLVLSVCLGIAVDDTIHVLANYYRLRREGRTARAAIEDIVAYTGRSLITTSIILVVAFGTFAFGTFTPNVYFGVLTAIILSIALVTDLTLLPAILVGPTKKQPHSERAGTKPVAVGTR